VAGSFRGHEAVVVAVEGAKAWVSMMMFGELRTVSVDVGSLTQRD
jgi:hypothetical protein